MGMAIAFAQLLFMAATAGAPEARIADDTFVEAISRLRTLYRTENFVQLDKAFDEAVRDEERYSSGDSPAHALYWMLRFQMPSPGTDPHEIERIGRWQARSPNSPLAYFARCRFLYAFAWNARGTSVASDLDQENWKRFGERLRRAETCLINSPPVLKDTPLWHHLMIAVSQDQSAPNNSPDALLEQSARKWPRYYGSYEVRLTRLGPAWGGSWEAVEEFISKWAARQSQLEGDTLYARLYFSMQREDIPAAEIERRWPRLRTSFRELIERYPDPDFKNRFASYACRVRDKESFRNALHSIRSDELDPSMWMRDAQYEKCLDLLESAKATASFKGGEHGFHQPP